MERVLCDRWGATAIVSRGRVHDALHLPALIAERAGMSSGLVTYRVDGPGCELVTLDALTPYQGTGTVLVEAVARIARGARCTRLWLITTHDNLDALRFYPRRGFVLVAVHRDAVSRAKPYFHGDTSNFSRHRYDRDGGADLIGLIPRDQHSGTASDWWWKVHPPHLPRLTPSPPAPGPLERSEHKPPPRGPQDA